MAIEIQNKAFTSVTVGLHRVKTSALSDAMTASTSQSLASLPITDSLAGSKKVIEFVVETAFANVAATLILEGSLTGDVWTTLATISSDTEPDVVGTKVYTMDTSTYGSIPYVRFHFNPTGLTISSAGKCQFRYSTPNSSFA